MGLFKYWLGEKPGENNNDDSSFEDLVENLNEGDQLIIFKASPRCFASLTTEKIFDEWFDSNKTDNMKLVKVNVIAQRPFSNLIAEKYGIVHESPQVIWLDHNQQVLWHGSHGSITVEVLNGLLQKQ